MNVDATPSFLEAFKLNPVWIGLAFLVAGAGLVAALVGLALLGKKPKAAMMLGIVGIALGSLSIAVGLMGSMRERARGFETVTTPGLDPADKARVLVYSQSTANWNMIAGAGFGALPFALGVLATMLGKKRSAR